MKENILNYPVDTLSIDEAVDSIFESFIQSQGCKWFACLNPHSYVISLDDLNFSAALKNANWLIPDGSGIVLASRFLGGKIRERVTGSDIFYALLRRMNTVRGLSVFFLGAAEDTLALICERMAKDYPYIRVAGVYSPPFKPNYSSSEIDVMIDSINAVKPDVLWVGMTAPKQEKWIYENLSLLNVKFAGAIGAVFDFYSGKVKRSHSFFQRLGLEWLPRLLQQPSRLWQRNFISTPLFLWHVVCQKLFGKHKENSKTTSQ